MSISKIKVGSQIYDIKDNDILQKTSTENVNVFFKVNEVLGRSRPRQRC